MGLQINKSLMLHILVVSLIASPVDGDGCHAITKIRKPETRPPDYAVDGCLENPLDDIYLTGYSPRVSYAQWALTIVDECQAFCQGRGASCVGYITVHWFDQGNKTPTQLFKSIGIAHWEKNEEDEKKADCICLEKSDISDKLVGNYSQLEQTLRSQQYQAPFPILQLFANYWSEFTLPKCDGASGGAGYFP